MSATTTHADVRHDHLGTLGCRGQGDGPTDASAGAGDGDDLAVQECSHWVVLLMVSGVPVLTVAMVCRGRWDCPTGGRAPGRARASPGRLTIYWNLF